MNQFFNVAMAWIKDNKVIAGIGAAIILLLFMPKLFRTARRRRRIVHRRPAAIVRRRKRTYSTGGPKKRAWQIKGSLAARRHMAKIRSKR